MTTDINALVERLRGWARAGATGSRIGMAEDMREAVEALTALSGTAGDGWRPIDAQARDGGTWLVTDGGWTVEAIWEEVDYDEFRGKSIMGWTYGPAEVDGSNFHPTHYRPTLPAPPAQEDGS